MMILRIFKGGACGSININNRISFVGVSVLYIDPSPYNDGAYIRSRKMLGTLLLCTNFLLFGITIPISPADGWYIKEANRQCVVERRRCLQAVAKDKGGEYAVYCGPETEEI